MKKCINCSAQYDVTDQEKSFLKKMDLPEPKICPECRSQRRWALRNQSTLYKRKCDFTGKEMVSLYASDSKHKVYAEDIWWSDKWDAMDYGRDFDFSRPFFEQFRELQLDVPRRGMHQDGTNENCEYITFGMGNKNCYLAFACFNCENTYFSFFSLMSKETIDCLLAISGELLYECIHCDKCYKSSYLKNCSSCTECYLMEDCSGCSNCIGCKNVNNKQYYIYNKPATKEEFEFLKQKLETGGMKKEKEKFDKWKLSVPNRFAHIIASQDSDGDYIYNGKNCHNCFGILIQGAEDSANCQMSGAQAKEMFDCSMAGQGSELIYEMQATSGAYHSAFVNFCRFSKFVYYCDCISNCEECFGCVGLSNKKYCILNKQYSKEEYEELKPKIVEHMKKTDEWGENFPLKNSPFPYNDTLAQNYYPLTKNEAEKLGLNWKDPEDNKTIKQTVKVDPNIDNVDEKILNAVLCCNKCGKNYKIIPQEYRLYKMLKVSIPDHCPSCRYQERIDQFKISKLYDRECMNAGCKNKFKTLYSKESPEIVYCESCYQRIII